MTIFILIVFIFLLFVYFLLVEQVYLFCYNLLSVLTQFWSCQLEFQMLDGLEWREITMF